MGEVDLWSTPCDTRQIEILEEGRGECHRVGSRAMIVEQPWEQVFRTAGSTSDRLGSLKDGDRHTRSGQTRRGGEPIGPAADDDRGSHCVTHS